MGKIGAPDFHHAEDDLSPFPLLPLISDSLTMKPAQYMSDLGFYLLFPKIGGNGGAAFFLNGRQGDCSSSLPTFCPPLSRG